MAELDVGTRSEAPADRSALTAALFWTLRPLALMVESVQRLAPQFQKNEPLTHSSPLNARIASTHRNAGATETRARTTNV